MAEGEIGTRYFRWKRQPTDDEYQAFVETVRRIGVFLPAARPTGLHRIEIDDEMQVWQHLDRALAPFDFYEPVTDPQVIFNRRSA